MTPYPAAPSQEQLEDILCLVLEDIPDVSTLTTEQRAEAFRWAAIEHLYASDNRVKRLPKPEYLQQIAKALGGGGHRNAAGFKPQ